MLATLYFPNVYGVLIYNNRTMELILYFFQGKLSKFCMNFVAVNKTTQDKTSVVQSLDVDQINYMDYWKVILYWNVSNYVYNTPQNVTFLNETGNS